MSSLSAVRARTTKALAGLTLPDCFAQSTCASAANAYERDTKAAKVSRRRLNEKAMKLAYLGEMTLEG